jgi:glycosyltransferase involved in cell wall biosynthesis
MHITLVVKILGPHGGTEEYVRAVGQALIKRGHQLSCLFEEASAPLGSIWSEFLGEVPSTRLTGNNAARATILQHHLAAHRPDVLFVHSASFSAEMYNVAAGSTLLARFVHDFRPVCLRVAKVFPVSRRNCPRALGYSCLLHGCSIGPSRGGAMPVSWNSLPAKLAEREVCKRFDRVMVASGFMRDVLLHNGFNAERVSVNPLFCPSRVPATRPRLTNDKRLIYLGQLQRFKGLSVLLQAMRRLSPTISLDVAGDGPWRSRYEAMVAAWGLGERVHFHGWVQRENISAILGGGTVLVVPSLWNEPFGLVGLEAMAHARPVVAFDVGGISEWLEDGVNGVLVRRLGAEPLAAAIRELLADPERVVRLGARGYGQIQERFSLDRHVQQLLAGLEMPASLLAMPVP